MTACAAHAATRPAGKCPGCQRATDAHWEEVWQQRHRDPAYYGLRYSYQTPLARVDAIRNGGGGLCRLPDSPDGRRGEGMRRVMHEQILLAASKKCARPAPMYWYSTR